MPHFGTSGTWRRSPQRRIAGRTFRVAVPRTSTDLGPLSQNPLLVLATRFSRGRRVLFPLPTIDREMVDHLKGLVHSRQFTPVVDRTYPLEQIVEAYRHVETQQKVGNVVVSIATSGDR